MEEEVWTHEAYWRSSLRLFAILLDFCMCMLYTVIMVQTATSFP